MTSSSISPSGGSLPWGFESEGHRAWTRQVELSSLTTETTAEDSHKEITKQHWKTTGTVCSNKDCKVKFSLILRSHHCRRCGGSFCENCLQYRRKLNQLANPDPEGKPYKVCRLCFEEGKGSLGVHMNLTSLFFELRSHCRNMKIAADISNKKASWRNRFDLEDECKRLTSGFKSAVGNSELRRSLQEMRTLIAVPDWHKSPYWTMEATADTCQSCKAKFSLLRKKHHCRLCSKVMCKSCSSKDLLVYIPDEERSSDAQIQLAIIKVNGSPTVEPEVSLSLRICKPCQDRMTDRQLDQLEKGIMDQSQYGFTDLITIHASTQKIRQNVDTQLTEYQVIVESLEDNSSHGDAVHKSNVKTLAKYQEDVADFLTQLFVKVQHLKKLKPESNIQAILFRNCLKSNCDYYQDNLHQFRNQTRKLSESAPPEVLEIIQRTVDKNAIVSTQLYIRQLVYESIHLCDKHQISDDIPSILTPVDQAIEEDAKSSLQLNGDNWDNHTEAVLTMIHSQMKNHRLIKPSRRLLGKEGPQHAADVLKWRCSETLQQVFVQLKMKSSNRSFQKTKAILEDAGEKIKMSEIVIIT